MVGELKILKTLDYEEYGGVPVLGINKTVFKCHGNSNVKSIKYCNTSLSFCKSSIMEQIKKKFAVRR